MPIMGFLGTVIGITMALNGIDKMRWIIDAAGAGRAWA